MVDRHVERAGAGEEALYMLLRPKDRGAAVVTAVEAAAVEDRGAVVERVGVEADRRLLRGDEVAVEPDEAGLLAKPSALSLVVKPFRKKVATREFLSPAALLA